jgi:hypothetical protein
MCLIRDDTRLPPSVDTQKNCTASGSRRLFPIVQFTADMTETYEDWLGKVKEALSTINMPMDDWQAIWPFDFREEYQAGEGADRAAMKANRFWWRQQNKSLKQECQRGLDCCLPSGHQGPCQSVSQHKAGQYEPGDYIKVEFPDEANGIGEWMWVRVARSDDEKRIVFGVLDNEPIGDYEGKIRRGSELAIMYSQIRDHKKPNDFRPNSTIHHVLRIEGSKSVTRGTVSFYRSPFCGDCPELLTEKTDGTVKYYACNNSAPLAALQRP